MRKVIVFMHLTLDGVMQAPAGPDEDRRGGFPYGGWARPRGDAAGAAPEMGASDLLFGRRTYEDFFAFWPNQQDNPYTTVLNAAQKYVASTTLEEPLPWANSTLLKGDAAETVSRLKQQPGKDLVVLGSGALLQSLMRHNLVDEYILLIHPLVLGAGRRLFAEGSPMAELRLVDTRVTDSGVVIATYRTADVAARDAASTENSV